MRTEHIVCALLVLLCAIILVDVWRGAQTGAFANNPVEREAILKKMTEAGGPVKGFEDLDMSDKIWICKRLPGSVPFFEGEILCSQRLESRISFLVQKEPKE